CMSAGEPLNPKVIKICKDATGLEIYDYYGQTETIALISNFRSLPIKYGSMGKPTPGHVVEVVNEDGKILPVGEEGYIAVKVKPFHPPGIFKGYWKDEEKTQSSFRGEWYYTGDKAYKDSDGYFWFVGRADDVIKSSGYRIGPFEVESALQEHPAVAESAVIGVPDEMRGQIVKAFVILKPGYEPSEALVKELQEHVKKVTAPYKYPREIEFVKELPKTASGKIKRAELRKIELTKRKI
ncbi:MAG: AMP-binding protein, partial [Archaeoglobaceae archaeon]